LWRLPTLPDVAPVSSAVRAGLNLSVRVGVAHDWEEVINRGADYGMLTRLVVTPPVIQKKRTSFLMSSQVNIVAASYFTGCSSSIIGGAGLNFSVRDGKR
jgi:hypothetical protein